MKKIFFFIAAFISVHGIAQNKKEKTDAVTSPSKEIELEVYHQAMEYGDANVAINSLYILIVKHPENISYKDSLAQIYFQISSYNQCLHVCEDLLRIRPQDTLTLRMLAVCYQSLGNFPEAINAFEQVSSITGNAYDLYQKAVLEYRVKHIQESKKSVERVMAIASPYAKITLYIDQDNKQEVYLRSAAYNLYGMITKDLNDTATARKMFNKAIESDPTFYFALSNLKDLNDEAARKTEQPSPVKENAPDKKEKKKQVP